MNIWKNIPSDIRPKVRFWLPGAAMDENDLRQEMRALHERGFGGVECVVLSSLPEGYLAHADAYDFYAECAATDTPFLLLQGGHDYQITTDDFRLWQERLAQRPFTTCLVLPHCDHLLRRSESMATPQSYTHHLPLDSEAVGLIIAFTKNPKQFQQP